MAQKDVLAAMGFTKRMDVHIDDIARLRDEISLELNAVVEVMEFFVTNDNSQSLTFKYLNATQPASEFGSGYNGSWVIDASLPILTGRQVCQPMLH